MKARQAALLIAVLLLGGPIAVAAPAQAKTVCSTASNGALVCFDYEEDTTPPFEMPAPNAPEPAPVAASKAVVGKPASLTVSTSARTVSASWKRPSVTGKLGNYTVTLKQGSRTVKTINTSSTKASFPKLTEGTTYRLYVKAHAVSADGKNKASAYVSQNAKTKLTAASTVRVGKPASLKAVAARSSVTAVWKKPPYTGELTGYTVVVKKGSKTVKSYSTTGTQKTITGLKKNTSYTVHVRANAKSGNGKYTAHSAYATKTTKTKR
jgi:hypothetical protein